MRNLMRVGALALALLGAAQAATAVTNVNSNLRRTPNGEIMGVIPKNTLLTVACSGAWCRTSFQGRGGYISAGLIRPLTRSAPVGGRGAVFYASCAQMKAAGAAPIRVGKPGYRTGLDRDHDGWACRYDQQR